MWSDPRNTHPPYPAPPPQQARHATEASSVCWWMAGVAFTILVIAGIVFLAVRPSADDEVLCAIGSVTACDNWRQDRLVHLFAAYAALGSLGIALICSFVGIILTLSGE